MSGPSAQAREIEAPDAWSPAPDLRDEPHDLYRQIAAALIVVALLLCR